MILGDAVKKLETFVWILNHVEVKITFRQRGDTCDLFTEGAARVE